MKMRLVLMLAVVAALLIVSTVSAFAQGPITLTTAVPLTSGDVTNALTSFFQIGPVLGVVALIIALGLAPWILRTLRSLGSRR